MNRYYKFIIVILPLIFLWAGLTIHIAKFGNDPNYVYLVNSAAICQGKTVGYIDHPGTPVMQIGALTMIVKHSFDNPDDLSLTTHFLKDPHTFFMSIRNVFLFLNTILLLLLGWVAIKKTGSVWVGLILQASTLITTNTLDHIWTKVSPAPLLFFITGIYVIAILLYYAEKNKDTFRYVLIFSLISGAGLATKATFLPMVFFPLFVLPSYKKKLIYFAGIIPSFVLFTIPIIPEYKNMYYWFRDLTSHSGIYGHGDKGFIDASTYFPNILRIVENNPVFAIVVLVGGLIILVRLFQVKFKIKSLEWDDRFLAGLIVSSFLGILLVAKHYHANHYLIPELLFVGITVYFILKQAAFKNQAKYLSPIVALGFIGLVLIKQPPKIKYIDEGYKITTEEMESTHAMMEREYPEYTKIYYYPNSLNVYSALNFGDVYTQRRMLPEIKKVYGDIYFYNSIENVIKNWNTEIYLEDLIENKGNKILLVGGPHDEGKVKNMWERGFPLNEIYKGRLQAIYALDTTAYNYLQSNQFADQEIIKCDFENLSKNGRSFKLSNEREAGNAQLQSSEQAKSGSYSLKMDMSAEFSMEYKIPEVSEGDKYEINVWRNPANTSGLLVASAEDSRFFYKAQNEVVQTDENNWGLLKIKIEIPPEMDGKLLKFYLWNKDKKNVYFDDFTIRKSVK